MDNIRLPDNIEAGAKGGPIFNTSVITLVNGRENRNQEWTLARHSWDVSYGVTTAADYENVRQFFYARRGRARSFRFKDWADYQGTLEAMAAVAGEATKRQLVKTYDDGVNAYVRLIDYYVAGTLHIYVDTVETTHFTADKGVITFTDGDPGMNVVATFEFDIPVRFDVDQFGGVVDNVLSMSIPSLPILEVIKDDA